MNDESMTIHALRKRASAWLERYSHDVRRDSAEAYHVSQGRLKWPSYSGCADLAHAMFWDLGLRHQNINREVPEVRRKWSPRVNVSRLAGWGNPRILRPSPEYLESRADAGDVLIVWPSSDPNDAHVMVVVAPTVDGELPIAEHGQNLRAPDGGAPIVGRLRTFAIRAHLRRPIQVWLPLDLVAAECQIEGDDNNA